MNISNAYARNKALFLVVIVSLGLHVLALVIFGTFKIVESIVREEQAFEAPEILEVPQDQPEYQVNLEQRNQSSAPPRPNPIVVDSPDVTIPALDIDVNIANSSSYGRGTGGIGTGTGSLDMREMAVADLEFFGAKSTGSRIVMILDASHSAAAIFNQTRKEVLNTVEQMKGTNAQYSVIYFGGKTAGHVVGNMNVDPTKADFRLPPGVPERTWLNPASPETESIVNQLKGINPNAGSAKVEFAEDLKSPDQFFVLGTQFWGAINAAFEMKPPPDTVFFMVEPKIAFPNPERAERSYEWYDKHGRRKPTETTIQFIIGSMPDSQDVRDGLRYMVNELNGGRLSESEITERITTTR